MKNKLRFGILLVIFLVLIMIIGEVFVIFVYNKHSNHLIREYQELNVLHEYRASMNNLLITINAHPKYDSTSNEDIYRALKDCKVKFDYCEEFLSNEHKNEVWAETGDISLIINQNIIDGLKTNRLTVQENTAKISGLISSSIENVNELIKETGKEIIRSKHLNQQAIRHGSITLMLTGSTVILILFFGGLTFIQNLTSPIKKLVLGAEKIIAGDRKTRVIVQSKDEFKKLAETFNSMLDTLDETTVDSEYFRSIVDSLYGALFVLRNDGLINLSNLTAQNLFEYTNDELKNKSFDILLQDEISKNFQQQFAQNNFEKNSNFIGRINILISKSGKEIPVLINCTQIKKKTNNEFELLIVAHDITEKINLEKNLEQKRNEIRIAINEAQEAERLRLATDLHDGLGQQLTGISFSIQKLKNTGAFSEGMVRSIQEQIDSSLTEIRRLAHDLIPIVLVEFGLITAVQNLVERANKIGKTNFLFYHYDINNRLDNKIEKAIYRICQESINNIIKHANAANASIQLFNDDKLITIVIEDDGVGFSDDTLFKKESKNSKGIGILSIRERVSYFNGKITIESKPGEGTEIIIELPYLTSNISKNDTYFNS